MTPLFQVQASGWPFIAQSRTGLSRRWASPAASIKELLQGISCQRDSSGLGRMKSRHWAKFSSVRGVVDGEVWGCLTTVIYVTAPTTGNTAQKAVLSMSSSVHR